MASKIQIRRGILGDLPTLDVGEFGFTTDTNQLFIGGVSSNISIPTTISGIVLDNVTLDADGYLEWDGRSKLESPADNNILLTNSTGTDFGLLQLGGTTSSYPALSRKPGTGHLVARLADNSDNCEMYATAFYAQDNSYLGWGTRTKISAPADGSLLLTNNAGTDFGLLQFGGTTSAFPAIGRAASQLTIRLADNSSYGPLLLSSLFAQANVQAGASGKFWWDGRSEITSPADGDVLLQNQAGTDFGLLQFGGTTAAFPTLKRAGAGLEVKTADDVSYTTCRAGIFQVTGGGSNFNFAGKSRIDSSADGELLLTNSAGTDWTLLQLGGTSASYPALKRNGIALEARLADDSAYTEFWAGGLRSTGAGYVRAGTTSYFDWTNRSRMYSPADGNIHLTNNAGTAFGLLQFGGTTSAFPALKRSTNTLEVRLADDSARTGIAAGTISASSYVYVGSHISLTGLSRITSPVDGWIELSNNAGTDFEGIRVAGSDLALTDSAGTDFGLLQFGGTTNAYPALKRSGVVLHIRNAQDTDFTSIQFASATASATGVFVWNGRSRFYSDADGSIRLTNNAATDFGLLQFGGTTSAYPAIKRVDAAINFVKADDSGLATIAANEIIAATTARIMWSGVRSQMWSDADGDIRFTNDAGTGFNMLQFGGTTNAYPALRRSGTQLQAYYADGSGFTSFRCSIVDLSFTGRLGWNNRSRIYSDADGDFRLTNNTATDFGLLQFGGTTLGFPALKRVSDELQVRLADDSDFADLQVENLTVNGTLSVTGWTFADVEAGSSNYIGWDSRSRMQSPSDGDVHLTNNAGADFRRLVFGQATSSFPALERTGGTLTVRRADGLANASLRANAYNADGGGVFRWDVRSQLYSDSDGYVRLTDSAGTDFGLLQFGGTGAAFPALKRSGASFSIRLADDSTYTNLNVASITSYGSIQASGSGYLGWQATCRMLSSVDGSIVLNNNAENDFGLLQFGGTTAAYPALKRESSLLQLRLADDSGYSTLACKSVTCTEYLTFQENASTPPDSPNLAKLYVRQSDNSLIYRKDTGTEYDLTQAAGVSGGGTAGQVAVWSGASDLTGDTGLLYDTATDLLQFGGATSSFPALKRSGANLEAKLADDSARTTLLAAGVQVSGNLVAGPAQYFVFDGRTRISSPTDGELLLTNNAGTDFTGIRVGGSDLTLADSAGTDFGMLGLGGLTASYPGLKRFGASLRVRKADDTGSTNVYAGAFIADFLTFSFTAPSGGEFMWTSQSRISSPADGRVLLQNNLQNDFDLLQFGGVTNAYPALARSGNTLQVKFADGSTLGNFTAGLVQSTSDFIAGVASTIRWTGRTELSASADGNLLLTDDAATNFGLLQFGGTTNAYPALKRSGIDLHARLADDSNYTSLFVNGLRTYGILRVGTTLRWGTTGSVLDGTVDGNLLLTDDAGTDFGLLQFGGVTLGYPALKRVSDDLHIKLADDSAFTSVYCDALYGLGDIRAGQAKRFYWSTRSEITSPADGDILLTDSAGTDFGLLQLGGTTSAYPALKRSFGIIQFKSADDSSYISIVSLSVSLANRSKIYSPVDGDIRLTNNAATDFGLLQFGGTTSAFPAWKRNAAKLEARLADDSSRADILAGSVDANTGLNLGTSAAILWSTRSRMYSDADGNIRLTNNAGTSFGLLQFGGTTNAYPALKRSGAALICQLADDSTYAGFAASYVSSATFLQAGSYISAGSTNTIYWTNRSKMQSPADGNILLSDFADTDFGLLQLGGTTSAYPAIQRTGNDISLRTADDSSYTDSYARTYFSATTTGGFGWSSRTVLRCPADGDMRISNNADTDFNLLQFGGTTDSFPALKRNGAILEVRLADDSTRASLFASTLEAGSASYVGFTTRSHISSPTDGELLLTNNAGTDFDLLQFGGTGANYPALKRVSGTAHLGLKTADDLFNTSLYLDNLWATGDVRAGANNVFYWEGRSEISSPSDGEILLRNNADTYNADLTAGELLVEGAPLTTSTADQHGAFIRRTLNDPTTVSGIQEFRLIKGDLSITDDTAWENIYLMDLQVDGVSKFQVFPTGTVATTNTIAASTGYFSFSGRSSITSPADGDLLVTDDAGTDFGLLQFGGVTDLFPALKRASAGLHCRLADDSSYANLTARNLTVGLASGVVSWASKSKIASLADGNIHLIDNAETDFGLLQFGGTTSSFPALKRSTNAIQVRLADDSGYASLTASTLVANGYHSWSSKSRMYSDADSNIRLTNNAADDFGLLQFGGTNNSYPALKRSGNALTVRFADDSSNASMIAGAFYASALVQAASGSFFEWAGRSRLYSDADANVRLADQAGTDFDLLQFGGTTSSFPALKRNGAGLRLRLADDSGYTSLSASNFAAAGTGTHYWLLRSRMYSDVDGNIRLANQAGTDFGMLQFGGTSSGFPALKRSGAALACKLADDSTGAQFDAGLLVSTTHVQAAPGSAFRWDSFGSTDLSMVREAASVMRITDGSTGIGAVIMARNIEANTATVSSPNALTVLESNKVFTNEAATEKNGQALPPAVAGIQYTFIVQDTDGIRVIAQTGDTIRVGGNVSAAAGYTESTTVGDVITLVAVNNTEWFATSYIGTWTTV